MAEITKSPGSISGRAHDLPAFARRQAVFDLCVVRGPRRRHHRFVRLQHPPECRPHRSGRDRKPRRAQCRTGQFAGLCGGDGIPRRLHVDGPRRGEEIRRRIAQVQRTHSRGRQELAGAGPGRRRRAVRDLQEAHRTVHRLPQGTGSPRRRNQRRCGPRMGRQRRQPRGALGPEQGPRGAFQGLRRTQQEAGAADRRQPHDGLRPDLPRRCWRWSWSSSAC